jgi:hypothetical protein
MRLCAKSCTWIIVIAVWIVASLPGMARPAEVAAHDRELNSVFLHGAGGSAGDLQLLADKIVDMLPGYVKVYEAANPGVKLNTGILNRCYPNEVDFDPWANNVVESITKYSNKKNAFIFCELSDAWYHRRPRLEYILTVYAIM